MQNSQISFKSNIRITSLSNFSREIQKCPQEEITDWSIRQITKSTRSYTTGIRACTAGGILVKKDDGAFDVVMFHMNPINALNFEFDKIEQTILKRIGDNKPVQGFLLGSKRTIDYSVEMFGKLETFIKDKLKVPYTKFRGISMAHVDFANIAYDGTKNEWTIAGSMLSNIGNIKKDAKELAQNGFDEVIISDMDKLIPETDLN